MTVSYAMYNLQDGYLNNWLAAGPQAISLRELSNSDWPDDSVKIITRLLEVKSNITNSAVERGPLNEGNFELDGYHGQWEYYKCGEDHLVDLSTSYPISHYVRAWAYTELYSPVERMVRFSLRTFGPIEVWLNKKSVFRSEDRSNQPIVYQFEAPIKKATNRILISYANLASPSCVLAFSLKAESDPTQFQVRIPTLINSLERRTELESVYDQLFFDRDVYVAGDKITLNWPVDLEKPAHNDARFQTLEGVIYGQAEEVGKPGQQLILGTPASLMEGPYQAFITPRAWEYYESQIRITRKLDTWVMGRNRFSSDAYGTLDDRRKEALQNAASRANHLFAEIAKIELGKWKSLNSTVISAALNGISRCEAGSEINLLGLLGAVSRYGSQPEFPAWISEQVREAAVNFQYGPNQGGCEEHRFANPDHQIVFYACEILAGQLYPEEQFTHSKRSGAQERLQGEALAIRWMQSCGAAGLTDWDSKVRYANALTALSYLVDLAETEEIWELASILMDKLFFSIALNSFNGVFGSTQGYATSADIKGGMLDPTSGMTRLMWGMGVFNHHIAGTVSLACLKNYELPQIIADIATKPPAEVIDREHQGPVDKVTYRTPDYMLSSAQDYRPGEPGQREQIWQATLGPKAVVFTNHPGCSSENDSHAPNYWLGNGRLPRVAQWKDTLIALYKIPGDDILVFTHAYFPTYEFDEYSLQQNTAFARKGNGYLALTSSTGLELIDRGPKAFRELRSCGTETVWICQMGQSSTDGSFSDFQKKVMEQELKVSGLEVLQLRTLRGDDLKFGWESPLTVNDVPQTLSGFKHYENIYTTAELPCSEMEIKNDDYLLRLNFAGAPQE